MTNFRRREFYSTIEVNGKTGDDLKITEVATHLTRTGEGSENHPVWRWGGGGI